MIDEIPDSQVSEIATQTQSLFISPITNDMVNRSIETPWGRLFSCVSFLDPVDLLQPSFKLGRGESCDVVITKSNFPDNVPIFNISKEHFQITKDKDGPIFITDLSKNGTFVNGTKIGKDNKFILQNDDYIAIGFKALTVYIFKQLLQESENYLPQDMKNKYAVSKLLGKGACGEVHLIFDRKTCMPFAVKKISKARQSSSNTARINHPSKIRTEIEILKKFSHPFIIGMKEIYETEQDVFLILDYMPGGELTNRIISPKPFPESHIKCLFYQIVLAVRHLHNKGITHRDIKPENILLSSENDDEMILKVSDFGLSKIIHNDTVMETLCGTSYYVAPEVLDARYKEYNQQVDIWSLGVLLYYMLSKNLPFRGSDRKSVHLKIVLGRYSLDDDEWDTVSADAKDLVKRMLVVKPQNRITIDGILNHSWLTKDHLTKHKIRQLFKKATDDKNKFDNRSPPPKRARYM